MVTALLVMAPALLTMVTATTWAVVADGAGEGSVRADVSDNDGGDGCKPGANYLTCRRKFLSVSGIYYGKASGQT